MKITYKIIAFAAATLLSTSSFSQETGTLKKIKETGKISLGVRDSSIPFSYLDGEQNYLGYSLDLCATVVSGIQKRLGLSQLNVQHVPVTSATRIPLMANGTI